MLNKKAVLRSKSKNEKQGQEKLKQDQAGSLKQKTLLSSTNFAQQNQ